jgi:hypothetical protein
MIRQGKILNFNEKFEKISQSFVCEVIISFLYICTNNILPFTVYSYTAFNWYS